MSLTLRKNMFTMLLNTVFLNPNNMIFLPDDSKWKKDINSYRRRKPAKSMIDCLIDWS